MSLKPHIIKERFDISVTADDSTFKGSFELDRGSSTLLGILVTSDREDLLYYRGSMQIKFSDRELFPERFESKLLMSGVNVPPNQRVVKLGAIPIGNGKLDVVYKDNIDGLTAFFEYRVSIYTFCLAKTRHHGTVANS